MAYASLFLPDASRSEVLRCRCDVKEKLDDIVCFY